MSDNVPIDADQRCRNCGEWLSECQERCPPKEPQPAPEQGVEEKGMIEELSDLLTESKMQVTFTGWKKELEAAEKRIKELERERDSLRASLALAKEALEKDYEVHGSTYAANALSQLPGVEKDGERGEG